MSSHPDFDNLLNTADAYDSEIGEWWINQTKNKSHQKAYENLAKSISHYYKENKIKIPKFIVDYACGNGALMVALAKVFPKATIVGIDGSKKLLKNFIKAHPGKADIVSKKNLFVEDHLQFHLIPSNLPNFSLPKEKADLVVLCFPNLIADNNDLEVFNKNGYGNLKDNAVAEMLARFREMDPEDEVQAYDKEELFDELMTQKVFSRNLRKLLKKGGMHVRVEYANALREDLTYLTNTRSLFCEGALQDSVKDKKATPLFAFQDSEYYESKVIMDVYAQTQDKDDTSGGYHINYFKGI